MSDARWTTRAILRCLPLFMAFAPPVSATTLFQSDWSAGTGSTALAVQDGGRWSDWFDNDNGYVWYAVFGPDGTTPGGRNYLRLYDRPLGNSDLYAYCLEYDSVDCLSGQGAPMMAADPTVMFFRMWFRLNPQWSSIEHLIRIREHYYERLSTDIYIFTVRDNFDSNMSIGIQVPADSDPWIVRGHPEITDGNWHLWEVKVTNPGTSNVSFACRLDGADVTSTMRNSNSGAYLTDANGTLSTGKLNYQRWELYDHGGTDRHFADITGVMFTDGPDWIGAAEGVSEGTPPPDVVNVERSDKR